MTKTMKQSLKFYPMPEEAVARVEFEDHGQDFLFWDLDKDGTVVGSYPFQQSIWGGSKVKLPIAHSKHLEFKTIRFKRYRTMNYATKSIVAKWDCPAGLVVDFAILATK